MLFVLKTTYLIMRQHLPRLGKYLPDSLTFAKHFCEDSPTFAKPWLRGLPRLADIRQAVFLRKM
jgi:hypothetical protein